VALRFGNVYGPRQDPLGEAGVIAIFCGKLQTGGDPTVFGDGRQTRDYVFVDDVVRACMIAGGDDRGGAYNVGRGVEVSVLELVEQLGMLGNELNLLDGRSFEPQFAPARAGEVQRSALDPTRSREELGFVAETNLEDGLRRTLQSVLHEARAV
jgi:UDP-glucose 4-epimerase